MLDSSFRAVVEGVALFCLAAFVSQHASGLLTVSPGLLTVSSLPRFGSTPAGKAAGAGHESINDQSLLAGRIGCSVEGKNVITEVTVNNK